MTDGIVNVIFVIVAIPILMKVVPAFCHFITVDTFTRRSKHVEEENESVEEHN